MRLFFDTSALIPVFAEQHEHHVRSLKAFAAAERKRDFCAAHTLAEVFSVLTRSPGHLRVSAEQALLIVQSISERLTPIALATDEYTDCLERAAELNITGGAIYDLLIACCAIKTGADKLYTWNLRHFVQFGSPIAERVTTP